MKKLILPAFLLLTGCASIVSGTQQTISVETIPVSGASCKLSNDKGAWFVSSTPDSTTITRAYSDLQVKCTRKSLNGLSTVKSTTKAIAFGNIAAGGIIGGAIDMSTGAAYDYPSLVKVEMK